MEYLMKRAHILHQVENKDVIGACLPEREAFLEKMGVMILLLG